MPEKHKIAWIRGLLVQTNSENTQIGSNWKYKHIQLYKSVPVTPLTYVISRVRLLTGMDRNGPNNRNGPGITGTDLTLSLFSVYK